MDRADDFSVRLFAEIRLKLPLVVVEGFDFFSHNGRHRVEQSQPFIITGERSWAETGPLAGEIRYTENEDIAGPLTLGASISREFTRDDKTRIQQRVVVLGDGDFLSNAYLGNGGNLNLGMNIMNWLSRDETLIAIPVKTAPDLNLTLSPVASGIVAVTFLFGIPTLLAGSGLLIWVRRRRQ